MKIINVIFDDHDSPLIAQLVCNDDQTVDLVTKLMRADPDGSFRIDVIEPSTVEQAITKIEEISSTTAKEPKITFLQYLKDCGACGSAFRFVKYVHNGDFSAAWDSALAGMTAAQLRKVNQCDDPECDVCNNEVRAREVSREWIGWLRMRLPEPHSTKEEVIARLRELNVDV